MVTWQLSWFTSGGNHQIHMYQSVHKFKHILALVEPQTFQKQSGYFPHECTSIHQNPDQQKQLESKFFYIIKIEKCCMNLPQNICIHGVGVIFLNFNIWSVTFLYLICGKCQKINSLKYKHREYLHNFESHLGRRK
jgi:hypothetical protein